MKESIKAAILIIFSFVLVWSGLLTVSLRGLNITEAANKNSVNSVNNSQKITSGKKIVKSLSVKKKSVSFEEDEYYYIGFKVKASNGASKKVTVKSSNKKVATVKIIDNEIEIFGKKPGKATITVTTKGKNNKGKKISKKIKVTVYEAEDDEDDDEEEEDDEPVVETPQEIQTPPQITNLQKMKNYINTYGFTNSSGDKVISDSYYRDGTTYSYGIVINSVTGNIEFIMTSKGTGANVGVKLTLPLPNTNGIYDIICVVSNGGFSKKYNLNAAEITKNNAFNFYVLDGDYSELGQAENGVKNSELDLACTFWNSLLLEKVGIGLKDIGFTSYN